MRLLFSAERDRFEAYDSFAERYDLREAGFRFDGSLKCWHSADAEAAVGFSAHAVDDATAALVAERAAAAAEARRAAVLASRATDADVEIPAPEGLAYLPYQKAGIAYMAGRTDSLLGDDMGLGKTVQILGLVNADPSIRKVLIVCPAYLKLNWQREAERWLVRPMTIGIATTAKGVPDTDVVICNYDILSKPVIAQALRTVTWDVIGYDEAQYLKSEKAARTKWALGYKDKKTKEEIAAVPARRRVFASGTPLLNRPVELWPILRVTGLATSYYQFTQRYCDGHNDGFGWITTGASNLGELQELLRSRLMIRRLKADVLAELPPKRRQVVELEPETPEQRAVVREETKAFAALGEGIKELERRAAIARRKKDKDPDGYKAAVRALAAGRMAAFTEISELRHRTALAKVPTVVAHVQEVMEGGAPAVIVFAHHRDVADAIAAAFPGSVKVYGGMTDRERQDSVDAFQRGTAKVFVGTIKGAGTGLTLTAAPHVVFAEQDWTPGAMSQAEDRAHRIGQELPVLVQHLVLSGSIDCEMARRLVEKDEVLHDSLDAELEIEREAA